MTIHAGYRVYRAAGRRIFAAPLAPTRLRFAGLERYTPFSIKRKLFAYGTGLLIVSGLDALVCSTLADPIGPAGDFHLDEWLDQVRDSLGDPGLLAVVHWPPQADRGRIYVHLFDPDLEAVGFAKIALDASNSQRLDREAQTLQLLPGRDGDGLRTPQVLLSGRTGGQSFHVLEAIPMSARPVKFKAEAFPSRHVARYAGPPRLIPAEDVPRLSWWGDFLGGLDVSAGVFVEQLTRSVSDGVETVRAHGDLSPANMVRDGGETWLLDWEESRPDAPLLADEIAYHLSIDLARTLADPISRLHGFATRFLKGASPLRRREVMLALAFRHAAGIGDATLLINQWDQISFERGYA